MTRALFLASLGVHDKEQHSTGHDNPHQDED
jgi:hypothetical protein